MSTTPTGFVFYGVCLGDDEGEYLGTLTDDLFYSELDENVEHLGLATPLQGYDGTSCYVLAIKDSVVSVDWCGVESISQLRDVEPNPKVVSNMKTICDKYNIPFEPDWFVSVCYF